MLEIVSDNCDTNRTEEYSKGFNEGLSRVGGLTKPGRSLENIKGLLAVMQKSIQLLEDMNARLKKQKLHSVKEE